MNERESRTILEEGGPERVEFKLSLSQTSEVIQAVSGFANHVGGIIFVGVSNKGEALGCDTVEKTVEKTVLWQVKSGLQPIIGSMDAVLAGLPPQAKETASLAFKSIIKFREPKTVEPIRENPAITQEELVQKTGLTRRGIEWNISKLKRKGILRRVGPAKGGRWVVREAAREAARKEGGAEP